MVDIDHVGNASGQSGNAFIGVSLDSRLFSREWIRFALPRLLAKHRSVLFLLADDLLLYTRSVERAKDRLALDFVEANKLVITRSMEYRRFLESEAERVRGCGGERVKVKSWMEFADRVYVDLLRRLTIAFHTIEDFRISVMGIVDKHKVKVPVVKHFSGIEGASAQFVLDEIAMCLRVTEKDCFHFEYYPEEQIGTVAELYDGAFAKHGLTVDLLTGERPERRFEMLALVPQSGE